MNIYLAADHAGYEMKKMLANFLRRQGHKVCDVGADSYDKNDDYPLYVTKAAVQVARDPGARAIVIGASGQGEAMVANRFKGVRAAVFYGEPAKKQVDAGGQEQSIITGSREHNHANVLSLGARFLSDEEAKEAVQLWLKTVASDDPRHQRRVEMLDKFMI